MSAFGVPDWEVIAALAAIVAAFFAWLGLRSDETKDLAKESLDLQRQQVTAAGFAVTIP